MLKTMLIVDDDQSILKYLKEAFTKLDFKVVTASDGAAAIEKAIKRQPDIVLLDLELPKVTGDTVCKEIKARYPDLPVIMLTVKDNSADIVHGFDIGASDYMSKPFDLDELVARVNSHLKKENSEQIEIGDIKIDDAQKRVYKGDSVIKFTPREYDLLFYLATNADRVLSRDLILNRVWADKEYIDPRVVDVYVGYIRRKLEKSSVVKQLKTVRGFGYLIKSS